MGTAGEPGGGTIPISSGLKLEESIITPTPTLAAFYSRYIVSKSAHI